MIDGDGKIYVRMYRSRPRRKGQDPGPWTPVPFSEPKTTEDAADLDKRQGFDGIKRAEFAVMAVDAKHLKQIYPETAPKKESPDMGEKTVQNAILREFGTRSDMRIWRANTGVAEMGKGKKKRVVRFGVVGQADLTGIAKGIRIEIESKGTGGRQSKDQKDFQAMIKAHGGIYILAYSVDDVWARLGLILGVFRIPQASKEASK